MELSKTAAGRMRLGAATERIDRTVEELGMPFREDLLQGEKADVVDQPLSKDANFGNRQPEFLPFASSTSRADRVPMEAENVTNESGEVPPPTDEPGRGETRTSVPPIEYSPDSPAPLPTDMDVNVVDDPETDLKELLAVLHRDERRLGRLTARSYL